LLAAAVLLAGCSLRDVDRYSAGSAPLDHDAGCKPGGASCIAAKECCSGACEGICTACKEIASSCNPNAAVSGCCSGLGCRADDANLYTCQPVDSCTSAADELALAGQDMSAVMRQCQDACGISPANCSECISSATGLSGNCASCFRSWWYCLPLCTPITGDDCRSLGSSQCDACCAETCKPIFQECSGIASCPAVSVADAGP
jgi:hypothetical protein